MANYMLDFEGDANKCFLSKNKQTNKQKNKYLGIGYDFSHYRRRQWHPTLAWRIPGTAEPVGLPSMGSHRVGHD